jgi:hypothetical protein
MIGPSQEIVVAGDPDVEATKAMVSVIHKKFLPNKVLLFRLKGPAGDRLASLAPFVEPMVIVSQQPTVYVCEQYACQTPVVEVDQLESRLH